MASSAVWTWRLLNPYHILAKSKRVLSWASSAVASASFSSAANSPTSSSSPPLPPLPEYTRLSAGTPEDFRRSQVHFAAYASPLKRTERILDMVASMKGLNIGSPVDLYEHSVQTATRALIDGADEETVVCALLHDIGEIIAPACHGEVAGSLLRPYISEENYWVLNHHELFQAYYYGDAMGVDKHLRERFRDDSGSGSGKSFYAECERFCGRWDEVSFDPDYESLPLSEFKPMLQRILERKPYVEVSGLVGSDKLNRAKADLGVYDFKDWEKRQSADKEQPL